tara:strand:+ start:525 stop:1556 length:1032 start_codon:yes stop_codon:yes gene_type:complete
MEISFTTYRINLHYTFGISRSKNDWYDIVLVFMQDGEIIGRGEAAPSFRYNESTERILSVLKQNISLPEGGSDRGKLWNHIYPQLQGIKSLEAAFSMALWDWWGQKQKKPVSELLGLDTSSMPLTSFTIAIGELDEIGEKIKEAEPYSILKVKLGTPDMDRAIIQEIRQHTDKVIRVDANEGWQTEQALELCKWLADRNIEFIEQPFPAGQLDQTALLRSKSPLDIYADENSLDSADIPQIHEAFDGVNIKLMKCGSIEEGQRMIHLAKFHDMKIMLGCMVETSVGITAASHLAGEVDAADLDGNLLINNDPYSGVKVVNGRLVLPNEHGIGLALDSQDENLI